MDANQTGSSRIAQMIWVVGSPVVFTIGVIGNTITIIVLTKKQNRNTSTGILLSLLAFADLMIMLFLLPRWWIIYTFGIDIRLANNGLCKVHWFMSYFFTMYSALALVILTVERIISTTKPYKVKVWCSKNIALKVSAVTAVFLVALVSHVFYGFSLEVIKHTTAENNLNVSMNASEGSSQATPITESNKTRYTCLWTREMNYKNFYTSVFQWFVVAVYNIVPQTVFLFGGIVIVKTLARSRSIRTKYKSSVIAPGRKKTRSHSTQITITLLAVNVVFFLCTTPVQIFMSGRKYWINLEKGMTELQEILWAIFNLLFYLNHAINFVLYFMSGTKFRTEVLELFSCRSGSRLTNMELSTSNMASVSDLGRIDDMKCIYNMGYSNI